MSDLLDELVPIPPGQVDEGIFHLEAESDEGSLGLEKLVEQRLLLNRRLRTINP